MKSAALVEAIEQVRQLSRGDARTGVADADLHVRLDDRRRERDARAARVNYESPNH